MGLTELWLKDPKQIDGKNIKQIIASCGEGLLKDGSDAAKEFIIIINISMISQNSTVILMTNS
jgi:hypothetical protein